MIKRFTGNAFAHSVEIIQLACILFIMTACVSPQTATTVPDQTGTPVPTETISTDVTLYRGNPQRTGVFDFPVIRQEPRLKWQTKLSAAWLMPPILADGVLYTGSGNGILYAVDVQTGEQLWSTDGFSQLENSGAISGDTLVVGGYDQRVRGLDRHTGEVLWKFQMAGKAVSDLLLSDGVVYVSDSAHEFPRGPRHLYALAADSGELLWTFETVATFLPAPALDENTIYVTTTGDVFALE